MQEFCYDDIDLYYYHSTDIDITRIFSILNYGILSAAAIEKENIPYYHRNYINSSCKNEYISVSHFPRTIWHHFRIENELYDSAANKVVFVLNGDIDALEKQHYKTRYKYTNERHVEGKINREDIIGILVRYCDLNKSIKDIPFKLNYSNWENQIKKCFDTILFINETYKIEKNNNELHSLIGKLVETKIYNKEEYKILLKEIGTYMSNYIYNAFKFLMTKEDPTLKDILEFYSTDTPIYVMTKYDIKKICDADKLITTAQEKYEDMYPQANYSKIKKLR